MRRGKSQSLSLVVPVGAASDVNRPAMSPTTSSRVSATSRISRPTSRVRARPTRLDKIKNFQLVLQAGGLGLGTAAGHCCRMAGPIVLQIGFRVDSVVASFEITNESLLKRQGRLILAGQLSWGLVFYVV